MQHRSQKDLLQRAKEIIRAESQAVQLLAQQLDENLEKVVEILAGCRGHVLVTGTGTSRFVAGRLSHLLCCCGIPSLFINAADGLHGGAGAIRPADVVLIISKGGRSGEINRFAEIARSRGARILALSENVDSPLARISDVVFHVKALEGVDPFGMIATGSSLVNCAAGDVLCILLLERTGYTKEAFAETHPGGAVGEQLLEDDA